MTMFSEGVSRRGLARCAVLGLALVSGLVPGAQAQSDDGTSAQPEVTAPPYTLFNSSTLTSSGNTVMASRVPVVLTGKTIYQDVTLVFDVSATGVLTLAPGYPKFTPSPNLTTANFKAGKYVGPSTLFEGEAVINVSGPGISSGGATKWSLASAPSAYPSTYPCSATWYVGPITSNPEYQRLLSAKIPPNTLNAYNFGLIGSQSCPGDTIKWPANGLIGVVQTGNTISIVSFTDNGVDNSGSVDEITYTLQ